MSGPGSFAASASGVSYWRYRPTPAHADEYLGADGAGSEYYTRGGHVYALDIAGGHTHGRGRFAAFNRISCGRSGTREVAV